MFINCRHCNALVATDPATDLPPERCPRCAGLLREEDAAPREPVEAEAVSANAAEDDASKRSVPPSLPDPEPGDAWQRAASLVAALDGGSNPAPPPTAHDPEDSPPEADTLAPEPGATEAPVELSPEASEIVADSAVPHEPELGTEPAVSITADAGDHETPADVIIETSDDTQALEPVPMAPATKPSPSFIATRAASGATSPQRRWLMTAAIASLSLLLLLQILLADRARLAEDARWRPVLSTLCGALGCALPPWREPDALQLLARDVRPDPARPGVLRASATFRNDARWPQAWPRMALTLSDVEGRTVGTRTFEPHEYLGGQPTENTLSSGQSAMVRLDVLEPAANVVAFSFEFH